MSTLAENIAKIRTAPKGTVVREAIASAIEQTDSQVDTKISGIQTTIDQVDSRVVANATVTSISGDDYRLVITPVS